MLHKILRLICLCLMLQLNFNPFISLDTVQGNGQIFIKDNHSLYYDSEAYLYLLGEVENNSSSSVSMVRVTVTYYDADGRMVATDTDYSMLDIIPPGVRSSFKIMMQSTPDQISRIRHYDFRLSFSSIDVKVLRVWETSRVSHIKDPDLLQIYGAVRNVGEWAAKGTEIIVTCYDPDGKVILAETSTSLLFDTVGPGVSRPFAVWFTDRSRVQRAASYRVQVESIAYPTSEAVAILTSEPTPIPILPTPTIPTQPPTSPLPTTPGLASSWQVKVNPDGKATFTLNYTGRDFEHIHLNYTLNGEAAFKTDIANIVSRYGWDVDGSRIGVGIDRNSKIMTLTFTVDRFAEQLDATNWKITLNSIKSTYDRYSKLGNTFTFTSTSKPRLPLPDIFKVVLPETASSMLFDSNKYLLVYQIFGVAENSGISPVRCVVATAVYDGESAPEVAYMRYVRDSLIGSSQAGRMMVEWWNTFYYLWSPPIARCIAEHVGLKQLFRVLLEPLTGIVFLAANVYLISSPIDPNLASVVTFIFAAVLSITVYVTMPTLILSELVRIFYKRIVKF
ncbi:MAG: FxLYD domain-containing protein [Candidatus Bathyarchaeia archaeon]